MTKSKAKPAQSRPRQRQRQRAQPRKQTPVSDSHPKIHQLCGLTDPFCPHARGARIPDIGASKTLTESIRFIGNITTNASGNAAVVFTAKADNVYVFSDPNDNGTVPKLYNQYEGTINSILRDHGSQYRVVTYGVRVVNTLSATDSTGVISFARGPQPTLDSFVSTSPNSYFSYESHSNRHGGEWAIVGRPTGGESMDWSSVADKTTTTSAPPDGYENLYILLSGYPASAPGAFFEFYVNYEFTLEPLGALQALAQPQPIYDPSLLVARNEHNNNVSRVHKGGTESASSAMKQEAKKAFTKHVLPAIIKRGEQALASALV